MDTKDHPKFIEAVRRLTDTARWWGKKESERGYDSESAVRTNNAAMDRAIELFELVFEEKPTAFQIERMLSPFVRPFTRKQLEEMADSLKLLIDRGRMLEAELSTKDEDLDPHH